MGIYRVVWRSGMGAVAVVGAVFAVLDLPADALLALGLCAVVLGASAAAVIRAGTRSAWSMSGVLSASAVAVVATCAVAGLLTFARSCCTSGRGTAGRAIPDGAAPVPGIRTHPGASRRGPRGRGEEPAAGLLSAQRRPAEHVLAQQLRCPATHGAAR